jgi:hypothetical protein
MFDWILFLLFDCAIMIRTRFRSLVARYNESRIDDKHLWLSPSASRIHLGSYFGTLTRTAPPCGPPPPYEDGCPVWQVRVIFGSDADKLRSKVPLDLNVEWTAQLYVTTWDLPGLMRDGLHLTPENVQEQDNHFKWGSLLEGGKIVYPRSYTVIDSRWSGHLHVCAWTATPLVNFRIHHLSAAKVLTASVGDDKEKLMYCYDLDRPEHSFNCVYDDMPLDGLWPWPKREEKKGENGEKEAKRKD